MTGAGCLQRDGVVACLWAASRVRVMFGATAAHFTTQDVVQNEMYAILVPVVLHGVNAAIVDFDDLALFHINRFAGNGEYDVIIGHYW